MKTERYNLLLSVAVVLALILSSRAFGRQDDESAGQGGTELLNMPLEELMNVEVESTASLTKTARRLTPATVTTITQEQIWSSGARNLFELFDIYVPNFEWVRHNWEAPHMGLRGIMNDRDDKVMILVNGRVMNERTHYGALSERDLVMLRDIHHIDIIRGPGSAMYGPGAISMVINIITENSPTFQGTELTSRIGAIQEFYSGEIKHGQKFDDGDGGFFIYGGISRDVGADGDDAPVVIPTAFDTIYGDTYHAGEAFDGHINRDGQDHRHLPHLKLHFELNRDDWDIWARYTRGGEQITPERGQLGGSWPSGWGGYQNNQPSYGYQQATAYIGHKTELSDNVSLDYAFSYDTFDYELVAESGITHAHREDEYYGKFMINWDVAEGHKIAVGTEYSHEDFGLKSLDWPYTHPIDTRLVSTGLAMPRWSTNMYSILGEYQWNISDKWTTFLGCRADDHTYVDWMFSPRATVIYMPDDKDTIKGMYARSVRTNFAEEMKAQYDTDGGDSSPETINSFELRCKRQHNKNLSLAASLFYIDLNLIAHSSGQNVFVGTQKQWGLELELLYRTDKMRFSASHGFTKLISFDEEPGRDYLTTAAPYGYGKDLTNWSNHITKFTASYLPNKKWRFDSSFRIYWGYPGNEDYVDYMNSTWTVQPWWPAYTQRTAEPGWQKSYRPSFFLNIGAEYKPSDNLAIRVDGFNLLGAFNRDLNKRVTFEGWQAGEYRCEAPAVAVSLKYTF